MENHFKPPIQWPRGVEGDGVVPEEERPEPSEVVPVTKRYVNPPTWPQLIALVTLFSTGSGIAGIRLANTEIPASQMRQIQQGPDNTELINTLGKLQVSIEKLTETVQILSTKVAILEDRARRGQQ